MAVSLPAWCRRLGAALAAVSLAAGLNLVVSAGAQAQGEDLDPALVQQGENIYGQACVLCHGPEGTGLVNDTRAQGPSLIGVGAASVDFMVRTGRMPAVSAFDPLIRRQSSYTQTERAALSAYVTRLTLDAIEAQDERRQAATDAGESFDEVTIEVGPGIPTVGNLDDTDQARGLELFTSNCAACHGPTAAGIAVGRNDVSSNLEGVEPIVVAEAIRVGPGVMPVFGTDTLPQDDLEAIVGWVEDVTQRSSPGGVRVGRGGPVNEGLIAWVVGIGLLGSIIYLLGEREGTIDLPDDEDDETTAGGAHA